MRSPHGLLDLGQPASTTHHFLWQFVSQCGGDCALGPRSHQSPWLGQQPGGLVVEPFLFFLHPLAAHRIVTRDLDLGSIQGDRPQMSQVGQGTYVEGLDDGELQPSQMRLAEIADGTDVGDVLADNNSAGDVGVTPVNYLPRGASTAGVAAEQQGDRHPGVKRRLATWDSLIVQCSK
jgi:hypothetical protein